ncbi:site-2 protease family protein [Candidatus Woesearchaeota archaeon]|nr:site-2 protease family protein [Candidatus Woesearchaeota archaeon]
MDYQLLFAIIFFVALSVYLYFNRSKLYREGVFPIFYMLMLKTSLGLKQMDKYSKKYSKFLDILSKVGVFVGFLGMFVMAGTLIYYLVKALLVPSVASGVQLVLPFKVKGTFYVPFFYWLSCLVVIVFVHEFSHGVIARLHKIPIKSSGLAVMSILIPLVPAAFVEPDEKKLSKKDKMKQLSVFAAGPFSNLIIALFCVILLFGVFRPVNSLVYTNDAVYITDVMANYSANASGIKSGDKFVSINGVEIKSIQNISYALKDNHPGDVIEVITFDESNIPASGFIEGLSGINNDTLSKLDSVIKALKVVKNNNQTVYYDSNGENFDLSVRSSSNSDSSYLGYLELRIAIDDSLISKLGNEYGNTIHYVNLSSNPSNSSSPYLGVYLSEVYGLKSGFSQHPLLFKVYDWIATFVYWLFLLNLGVGLFNLAPLGIVDGGRMLHVGLLYFLPKKRAQNVWKVISLFFLFIVISLLIIGFIFA